MATAKQIGEALYAKCAEITRNTMLLARKNVTNATPVVTGHMQSNWVLSIGRPFTGVDGSRAAVSRAAQENGDDQVANYSAKDARAGKKIYLRNNVFYAPYVDAHYNNFVLRALTGSGSTQFAPAGTKAAARATLRNVALSAFKRGRTR